MKSKQFCALSLTKTAAVLAITLSPMAVYAEDNSKQSAPGPDVPQSAPIKGFHPIKRALQPVENLEGMSIKLEQQIMKLEGPIAGLHPPMVALENRMTVVDDSMKKMETQVCSVNDQMKGVRSDLSKMQSEIAQLKDPIISIQKPVETVAHPLENVKRLLDLVLMAIVVAAISIVFGTPFTAVITYKYRNKLFPPRENLSRPAETRQPTETSV